MKRSLSSLPQGFLCSYYRNQSDAVKDNIRKGLGVFVEFTSSNTLSEKIEKKTSLNHECTNN